MHRLPHQWGVFAEEANRRYKVCSGHQGTPLSTLKEIEEAIDSHFSGQCEYLILSQAGFVMQFAAKESPEEPSYIEIIGVTDPTKLAIMKRMGYRLTQQNAATYYKESLFGSPREILVEVQTIFDRVFKVELSNSLLDVALTREAHKVAKRSAQPVLQPVDEDLEQEPKKPASTAEGTGCSGCLLYIIGVAALLKLLWYINSILWPV